MYAYDDVYIIAQGKKRSIARKQNPNRIFICLYRNKKNKTGLVII